jgi:VIT1/CCC1 family predicted Fe2+/Mn2+ transporter
MHPRHLEQHRSGRTDWLRAAVLGANEGIVSTASLMLGMVHYISTEKTAVTQNHFQFLDK